MYRTIVVIGFAVGLAWAYQHAANDKSRTVITMFGVLWGIGCIATLKYFTDVIRDWRKGGGTFVSVLQRKGLENGKAGRTFKEPQRVSGGQRAFAAWSLPVIFGVPALLMLVVAPMVPFGPAPFRPHPSRDLATILMFPVSILAAIGFLIRHCMLTARRQDTSLTDALYGWYYTYFQVNPAKRMSRGPRFQKRPRQVGAVLLVTAGALAIKFNLIPLLVARYFRQPENIFSILDLFPWLAIIIGVGRFLEELRYDD
ncbi:MAG: hypothetical protein NDJ89_08785 [Oligoflexia bacterium]|nr:hypothetical protein [Oligoflexia bacterium]